MDELGKALMNKKMKGLKISIEPMGDDDDNGQELMSEPIADLMNDPMEDKANGVAPGNGVPPENADEQSAISKMMATGGYKDTDKMTLGKRVKMELMKKKKV